MDHYSENVFLFNSTFHCETLNANCIYEDKNVLVFGPPPPLLQSQQHLSCLRNVRL